MNGRIETGQEGAIFISGNGIRYELLEGISMNGKFTSDIFFVMFTLYDCDLADVVGFSYGATHYQFLDNVRWINGTVNRWEENHKELIDDIKTGKIRMLGE